MVFRPWRLWSISHILLIALPVSILSRDMFLHLLMKVESHLRISCSARLRYGDRASITTLDRSDSMSEDPFRIPKSILMAGYEFIISMHSGYSEILRFSKRFP